MITPSNRQMSASAFYCDPDVPGTGSDGVVASERDQNLPTYSIMQSRKLPYALWYVIAKSLGIKLYQAEKPWIGTIMYMATIASALGFAICGTYYTAFDIISEYTKSTIMDGSFNLLLGAIWCSLGIYANGLAYKLFRNRSMMDKLRLHAKTVFKINSALLTAFLAVSFMMVNSCHVKDQFQNSYCEQVQLNAIVCKVYYVSRVVFSTCACIWNVLVAIVCMSLCRTHTIGIRRFIKQLEIDGARIEKRQLVSSNRSFHTDIDLVDNQRLEMDEIAADVDEHREDQYSAETHEGDSVFYINIPDLTDETHPAQSASPINSQAPGIRQRTRDHPERECSIQSNVIYTNNDILLIFWKISSHLRMTSLLLERWLCSWVALVMLWTALYLLYWLDNTASTYDVIEFLIPLILLPLVCSAFAEVNNEGIRVLKCVCPTDERMHMLFYLSQFPIQITAFNNPVTYSGIIKVIMAIGFAFASKVIIDLLSDV
ncbi:PREDICTED: uncharacterized protein LOC106815413 isoform X2 [Priapulus caudatus]|uniref:Uncharacterized protein LOC106815413 isoform X2 n=1 Tax=Priapulus caudatus TaxID=37621 RepID=A0ABM1ET35_PRICU|nr:PREDICTED: uncharacterized protein LOC106815413 isoform X2 [Priapulus caudatus]